MLSLSWKDFKYFKAEEFDSPDLPGSGETEMNLEFVAKLEQLREITKRPFFITSGYRTLSHHKQIYYKSATVPDSAHLRGLAADIRCLDSQLRFLLIEGAIKLGFKRIETAPHHVHLDMDESLPQNVLLHLTDN